MMEQKTTFIDPLYERIEEYGKVSFELVKLKALDKTSAVASTFVSRAVAFLVLAMFFLVLNIGVALWLGDLLGKSYYGFFCIAGLYGVIGSVLYFFMHKWMKARVSNSIITQMLN